MALYDSAYLLKLFNRAIGRPNSDAVTPSEKFERLTDAQTDIVTDIAGIAPWVLYPTAIQTMITTDNKTFTFGTDSNGYPTTPMGKVQIARAVADFPTNLLQPNINFIPLGGTAIQIPNDNTEASTLYWRGITPPGIIDDSGSHEPVLFPEGSRRLIAIRAAIEWMREFGRNPDAMAMLIDSYGDPLGPRPALFARWCQVWKTQFFGGGVLGSVSGLQVAVGSSTNMNAGF